MQNSANARKQQHRTKDTPKRKGFQYPRLAKILDEQLDTQELWRGFTVNDKSSQFRALSAVIYGSQIFWEEVRREIKTELRNRRYENITFNVSGKIKTQKEMISLPNYDLQESAELFYVAANRYQKAIALFHCEESPQLYLPDNFMNAAAVALCKISDHYDFILPKLIGYKFNTISTFTLIRALQKANRTIINNGKIIAFNSAEVQKVFRQICKEFYAYPNDVSSPEPPPMLIWGHTIGGYPIHCIFETREGFVCRIKIKADKL